MNVNSTNLQQVDYNSSYANQELTEQLVEETVILEKKNFKSSEIKENKELIENQIEKLQNASNKELFDIINNEKENSIELYSSNISMPDITDPSDDSWASSESEYEYDDEGNMVSSKKRKKKTDGTSSETETEYENGEKKNEITTEKDKEGRTTTRTVDKNGDGVIDDEDDWEIWEYPDDGSSIQGWHIGNDPTFGNITGKETTAPDGSKKGKAITDKNKDGIPDGYYSYEEDAQGNEIKSESKDKE